MAAAGQPDGEYTIGDLDVVVAEGVARLKSNGALAGSTLTMQRAVDKAREFEISEDVIRNASIALPSQLLDRTR